MSVENLFNLDFFDRDDYFNEKWDEWTRDELILIVEKANLDEDLGIINNIANHPLSTEDDLKNYALSGKFGSGVIKAVLMNDNCSEEIIRDLYNRTANDKIFNFDRVNDDKKWGDGSFEKYINSYIVSINELAKAHKNFPADLKS
jgi:hypothetical protein